MSSWGLKVAAPALLAAIGALSFACGSMSDSSAFGDRSGAENAGSPGASMGDNKGTGAGAAAPELVPTDNGVIMVHAAGMPAFRLCFESDPDLKAQPDRDVMPNANVVGVEIGSAVRIAPLSGPPGRIWIFPESSIRAFTGQGETCRSLIEGPLLAYAYKMPAITADFSKGVHLLVVRGCKGEGLTTYTEEECGTGYDPKKPEGNLSLAYTELKGANRQGNALPTQVLHLSQAIENARGTGELSVSFGDVTTNDSEHASIAANPALFGNPQDLTQSPAFDSSKEAVYGEVGFRVKITPAGGGTGTILSQQTLADVQAQSAPKELPSTYYSAASNYVLLLLGNPNAKLPDGGADDDPLRKVHLLAVPVIDPKDNDAGASDAGAAPDGAL